MNTAQLKSAVKAKVIFALCVLLTSFMSGCAAWTNPVANGIPVRLLPEEFLAESKEDLIDIPWGMLQRTPPETKVIEPEDVLGVYIVGVLGTENQLPPVQLPDAANVPPALGFPIPVRSDGTIPLPYIEDPVVAGMTVEEAEAKIIKAYTSIKEILQPDQSIILTMIRPRHVRILVVREDALGSRGRQFQQHSGRGLLAAPVFTGNAAQQGAGFELRLPATEADVLTALAETGGLPGLDAKSELKIFRKRKKSGAESEPVQRDRLFEPDLVSLKIKKGTQPTLTERDISLDDGDILVVETRESQHYYTAGLMFNQEVPLPFDYDLTVVEAITRVGGPMINGGFGGANLNGNIVNAGLGNPSPSLLTILRTAPNGQQVPIRVDLTEALRDPRENILIQDGDYLVLQETTGESFVRYISSVFDFRTEAGIRRIDGRTIRSTDLRANSLLP